MVRVKGLEPPRIAAPDPKSGVSTNSTTLAQNSLRYDTCQTLSSGFESIAFIAFYVTGRYSEKKIRSSNHVKNCSISAESETGKGDVGAV